MHLHERIQESHETPVRITCILSEIQTEHLVNIKLEHHCHTNLFSQNTRVLVQYYIAVVINTMIFFLFILILSQKLTILFPLFSLVEYFPGTLENNGSKSHFLTFHHRQWTIWWDNTSQFQSALDLDHGDMMLMQRWSWNCHSFAERRKCI
jgi:hypothetical protein